jgi:hypothetical protein
MMNQETQTLCLEPYQQLNANGVKNWGTIQGRVKAKELPRDPSLRVGTRYSKFWFSKILV